MGDHGLDEMIGTEDTAFPYSDYLNALCGTCHAILSMGNWKNHVCAATYHDPCQRLGTSVDCDPNCIETCIVAPVGVPDDVLLDRLTAMRWADAQVAEGVTFAVDYLRAARVAPAVVPDVEAAWVTAPLLEWATGLVNVHRDGIKLSFRQPLAEAIAREAAIRAEGRGVPAVVAMGHIGGAHNHDADPVCRICGTGLRLWPQTVQREDRQ